MPNPVWVIDAQVAQQRIANFLPKKQSIEKGFGISNETKSFEFTANDFLKYFEELTQVPNIGGVRLYFANMIPPNSTGGDADEMHINSRNKLALIIAPTTILTVTAPNESAPDLGNTYYFIYRDRNNNTIMRIVGTSSDEILRRKRWKESYLAGAAKHEHLVKEFKVYETRSIWYNLPIFKSNDPSLPGMIEFIKTNNISKVIMHIASRSLDEPYPNQLDIVYELNDGTNQYYTRLNIDDINKSLHGLNDKVRLAITTTYGDTGIPCPPRICN